MDPVVVTIVALYLLGMLAIGWWSSRRIQANDDFMVAGRRLGPFMLAGTLAATEVGGGSSLGVAEKAYGAWGLSAAWYVLAMAITFIALTFVAPRLRREGVKTVPEYFRRRYGSANGLVTAIVLILPMIGLTAIQIMASATVLSVMTGMSYDVAVVVVTVVVTGYSVMGGLWSVTLTDVVQWMLILVGSALVVPFALDKAGGWASISAHLPADKLDPTGGIGWKTIASLSVMYFASFAVGQESMQRYFAARDEKAARRASVYAGSVYVLYAFIPALIGVVAFGMVAMGLLDGGALEVNGARYVLPTMAAHVLPPVVVGLLFAALISATMSSADSNLLAAGSIFANDIWHAWLRPGASDAQVLATTRWTMVAVAALSLGVALLDVRDMIAVLMFSFTLRAGGVFVPYVAGHYWHRATPWASLAAIGVGSTVVVLVEREVIGFFGFGAAVPGILASALAFGAVTLLSRRASNDPR